MSEPTTEDMITNEAHRIPDHLSRIANKAMSKLEINIDSLQPPVKQAFRVILGLSLLTALSLSAQSAEAHDDSVQPSPILDDATILTIFNDSVAGLDEVGISSLQDSLKSLGLTLEAESVATIHDRHLNANWIEAENQTQELPRFPGDVYQLNRYTLESEAAANLQATISQPITEEGLAIRFDVELMENNQISGLFPHDPNSPFGQDLIAKVNIIRAVEESGGTAHLELIARRLNNGTSNHDVTTSAPIVVIDNGFTVMTDGGDLTFEPGSLIFSREFPIDEYLTRSDYDIETTPRVALVTPRLLNELQQANIYFNGYRSALPAIGEWIAVETDLQGHIIGINVNEGYVPLVDFDFTAEIHNQGANLRQSPTTAAESLFTGNEMDLIPANEFGYLLNSDPNVATAMVGLTQISPEMINSRSGWLFENDKIVYYDGRGTADINKWFLARSANNQVGWLRTDTIGDIEQDVSVPLAAPTIDPAQISSEVQESASEPEVEVEAAPEAPEGEEGVEVASAGDLNAAGFEVFSEADAQQFLLARPELPSGIEPQAVLFKNGTYYVSTLGDSENSPRFRIENNQWVDQHPGRNQYENLLPGQGTEMLFNSVGEDNLTWNQEFLAYQRSDGALFYPNMGVREENGNYDADDLRQGWVRSSESFAQPGQTAFIQSSNFVAGRSGLVIHTSTALTETRFLNSNFDMQILNNQRCQDIVVNNILALFPELNGKTLHIVYSGANNTGNTNLSRPNGMDAVSNNFQTGFQRYGDANAVIITIDMATGAEVSTQEMNALLGIIYALDEMKTGDERSANEIGFRDWYYKMTDEVYAALGITQISDYFEAMDVRPR